MPAAGDGKGCSRRPPATMVAVAGRGAVSAYRSAAGVGFALGLDQRNRLAQAGWPRGLKIALAVGFFAEGFDMVVELAAAFVTATSHLVRPAAIALLYLARLELVRTAALLLLAVMEAFGLLLKARLGP